MTPQLRLIYLMMPLLTENQDVSVRLFPRLLRQLRRWRHADSNYCCVRRSQGTFCLHENYQLQCCQIRISVDIDRIFCSRQLEHRQRKKVGIFGLRCLLHVVFNFETCLAVGLPRENVESERAQLWVNEREFPASDCGSLFEQNVLGRADVFLMSKMVQDGRTFQKHRYARYATDGTFKHTNWPSGNLQDAKAYFSGKHKIYGYKVEISVLLNGIEIACSDQFPGATSDVHIMRAMARKHQRNLKNCPDENGISHIGPYLDRHTHAWALPGDKCYQGAFEFVRAVTPRKKPAHGSLTREDEDYNKKLSSDRIILENVFKRLCQLWVVMSQKLRWVGWGFGFVRRPCSYVCISYQHPYSLPPLVQRGKTIFNLLHTRQSVMGEDIAKKCRCAQQRYRRKCRRRIETPLRITHDGSEASLWLMVSVLYVCAVKLRGIILTEGVQYVHSILAILNCVYRTLITWSDGCCSSI